MISRILNRIPVAIAATGTDFAISHKPNIRGNISRYILELPDLTNAVTTNLRIYDVITGCILYESMPHGENDKHSAAIDIDFTGELEVSLHLSGVAGGTGGTAYVTLFAER